MSLRIRRLGYALGAEVGGLDLRAPLADETIAEIRRAWLDHVLLCFPDQDLSAGELSAFCSRFGPLDDHRTTPNVRHPENPFVNVNVSRTTNVDGRAFAGNIADHWHTDLSYTDRPASASFLNAKQLPSVGGNTLFANMYLAYESLSPGFRRLAESLEGVHDLTLAIGFQRYPADQRAELQRLNPPMVHPIVRPHPETGRKALYVGSRLRCFAGMTEEESQPLIGFLNAHATRYEFTYRHNWSTNDLLMWDNRCAMHRAVADYDRSELRRLQRCSLLAPKSGHVLVEAARV